MTISRFEGRRALRDILRLSVHDNKAVLDHFARGPNQALVLTDATDLWPARKLWTLDFFARKYGEQLGLVVGEFGKQIGKATTLGKYIAGMNGPLAETPGIWVDAQGFPVDEPAPEQQESAWVFSWRAFDRAPELRDHISPYPQTIPNIVAGLDPDMYKLLEDLGGFEFFSLYISRAGTITPLHSDHSHSVGSLAQLEGDKVVVLYDVNQTGDVGTSDFNPERPDFVAHPEMRGAVGYSTLLQPGDMLIIPPSWPHYTRALGHSVTVSHNFVNRFNFSAYFREQLQGAIRRDNGAAFLRAVSKRLGPDIGSAAA